MHPYHHNYAPSWHPGLGQLPGESGNQEAATALATAGSIAFAFGPVGAIVGAGLELAAAIVNCFKPCGNICVEATTIVNQVEPYLQKNNQVYFQNPNRTTADQASALGVATTAFNLIDQNCGNVALGIAGQNCISQRIGSGMTVGKNVCAFGQTKAGTYPPYCSVPYPTGVCWTWTLAYYDCIANDVPPGGTGVPTGPASLAAAGISTTSTSSTDLLPLILIAALVIGVVLL